MDNWIDREHHLRLRAEKVAALITQLWGDLPPLGSDPQLSTFIDAIAGDDDHGRQDHTVVYGDGLTYHRLAAALLHTGSRPEALAPLPSSLLQRLRSAGALTTTPASIGMAALPAAHAGAWEYDAITGLLSFDADAARLMGLSYRADQALLDTQRPAQMHPDDQPVVAAALHESLSTGRRYETRFRCLMPDGSYAWRASRARALNPTTPATASAGSLGPAGPSTRGTPLHRAKAHLARSARTFDPSDAVADPVAGPVADAGTHWTRLIGFIAADE